MLHNVITKKEMLTVRKNALTKMNKYNIKFKLYQGVGVMKIRVVEIPKEGLNINIDEDVDIINRILEETERIRAYFINSVHADLFLHNDNSIIHVKGRVNGNISMVCSRCLKDFTFNLGPEIDINFHPKGRESIIDEGKLLYEDMDIGYYADEIDISKIIRENLFLEIPIKPLCSINCKGLCPRCGIDLNEESCLCFNENNNIDIRFSKLKTLIIDNNFK
jgi:uncharacterized protein